MESKEQKTSADELSSLLSKLTVNVEEKSLQTQSPAKVLLEFWTDPSVSPDDSHYISFDKKPPMVTLPRVGSRFPNETIAATESKKTELPPMRTLFQVLKSSENTALNAVIDAAKSAKKKIVFTRRRVFKEVWLKGKLDSYWESSYASEMTALKEDGIVFIEVKRNTALQADPSALMAGYLFEHMCVGSHSAHGFFTLVSYDLGDFVLLLCGEVDGAVCDKGVNCEGRKDDHHTYAELKLTSAHPRYFDPLKPEDKTRLWVAMDLGGYSQLIRGHRNKFNNKLDILRVEKYDQLSGQLTSTPDNLRKMLLERLEKMWEIVKGDSNEHEVITFTAQQLVET
jgi:hypothetical protein